MGIYSLWDYAIYLAILFGIISFLLRFLFRRIKIDRKFLILISPYIIIGILIRLLADAGFFEKSQYWSITPGVYIVTILIGIVFTYLGVLTEKYLKIEYYVLPFLAGLAISVFLVYNLLPYIVRPERILYPIIISLLIILFVFVILKALKNKTLCKAENLLIIFAHLLDGSATFVAYNYFKFDEEHLLPRYLISLAGNNAVIMIPLKLVVVLFVLYMIERWYIEEKDAGKQQKNIYTVIKILIFILGIGPGIRDSVLPSFSLPG